MTLDVELLDGVAIRVPDDIDGARGGWVGRSLLEDEGLGETEVVPLPLAGS